jgi:hypothetical protein
MDGDNLKPEASRLIMSTVEIAIQACPVDILFESFVSSGLFFKVIAAVMNENVPLLVYDLHSGTHDHCCAKHEYSLTNSTSEYLRVD